jgi:hypothetical protein
LVSNDLFNWAFGRWISFCPIGKEELRSDLLGWSDPRDSWLFRNLCILGLPPPRCDDPLLLIADYAFGADDAPLLERLAAVAETTLCPIIVTSSSGDPLPVPAASAGAGPWLARAVPGPETAVGGPA